MLTRKVELQVVVVRGSVSWDALNRRPKRKSAEADTWLEEPSAFQASASEGVPAGRSWKVKANRSRKFRSSALLIFTSSLLGFKVWVCMEFARDPPRNCRTLLRERSAGRGHRR